MHTDDHNLIIADIAGQLKNRPRDRRVSLVRQGVSHKVPLAHEKSAENYRVQVGRLNRILHIDAEKRICVAESGVTFSDLVRETLKYGLVPYTVPELKTITIGGAVSGCSVESMSYKYGGFHDSCTAYEIITASGEVLVCSRERNAELFEMVHGSFGTLGIITKLTFKLHPAKPFVKMFYRKYETFLDYQRAIQDEYDHPQFDFMDGIIHARNHFTLCFGRFSDEAPYTSSYEGMKIFYKSTRTREEDYFKTHDYFFRYDTECHWISRNYGLENPVLRFLFGRWFLSSTKMIKTAQKLRPILKNVKPDVVVDVFVPMSKFQEFYDFYEREFDYFPLWIVPYRISKKYPWINGKFMEGIEDELFIDCAIYGLRQPENKDYYKMMDEELLKLRGLKTLISHNRYDPETFWKIYNRENYDRAKKITDPENVFQGLYEKTHRKKAC
ncbi:MAG TPA: FAD-binding oxidoreductase [Candidatus Gracilibacteria bacterium]|nr:FAD-binding oxidoreductase [Candidatus Gracilibacteria bacterium]